MGVNRQTRTILMIGSSSFHVRGSAEHFSNVDFQQYRNQHLSSAEFLELCRLWPETRLSLAYSDRPRVLEPNGHHATSRERAHAVALGASGANNADAVTLRNSRHQLHHLLHLPPRMRCLSQDTPSIHAPWRFSQHLPRKPELQQHVL